MSVMNPTPQATSVTRANSDSHGGSHAKAQWPHRTAIIILLSISAVLIWSNGEAFLLWPAFYAAWVAFFPWIAALGPLCFILAIILGLTIDMGVIAYSFGARVEAAFIVFPSALISLFIGGGFLAGLIIAVLTGMFIVMNENALQGTEAERTASPVNVR